MRILYPLLIPMLLMMISGTIAASAQAADQPNARQFYEIRHYTIKDEAGEAAVDAYLKDALIPALERQGVAPVGVFVSAPQDQNAQRRIVVVMPIKNAGQVLAIRKKLAKDSEYQQAAAEFLARENNNPAYGRIISELSVAMDCMENLVVPDGTLDNPDRVYELRTYESANERLGDLKVDMFNSGEVPIFHATGITPVFISQTVVGPQMPSLTYLSVFANDAARLKAWDDFRANPDWKVLSAEKKYLGTVSRIDKYILVAKPYSQM
ncbi:MAG: NIPSNAP family protein [Planctomycetaceae bacterium]